MYVLTKDYKVIQFWELGGIDYVKYAPTIEDLCDAFYVETNYPYADEFDKLYEKLSEVVDLDYMYQATCKYLYKDIPNEDEIKDILSNLTFTVYGMVKTDKGFIFVAKTNENGELELL